jgi:hypothetical protein
MAELNYQDPRDARREIKGDWRRRLFGPSRDEIWKLLADEINARHEPGAWWKPGRVVAAVGPWQITLDVQEAENYAVTRLRAPFANPSGFRFRIYRTSVFSDLGKMLGMQDIVIGDPAFDDAFIIQGNDERHVRALLFDPQLRALMTAQPRIMLEVKDDDRCGLFGTKFPAGTDELKFTASGVIKDLDKLRLLFDLFVATLSRLCEIGAATDAPPRVTL